MNPNGDIVVLPPMTDEEAEARIKAEGLIPIPEDQLVDVSKMTRQQRRQWYRDEAKRLTKADKDG